MLKATSRSGATENWGSEFIGDLTSPFSISSSTLVWGQNRDFSAGSGALRWTISGSHDEAEAHSVGWHVRRQSPALGGAAPMGVGEAMAATHNALGTRGWPFGISNISFSVGAIPVLAPLRDIPMHIKEPPGVAGKASHLDGHIAVDAVDCLAV